MIRTVLWHEERHGCQVIHTLFQRDPVVEFKWPYGRGLHFLDREIEQYCLLYPIVCDPFIAIVLSNADLTFIKKIDYCPYRLPGFGFEDQFAFFPCSFYDCLQFSFIRNT